MYLIYFTPLCKTSGKFGMNTTAGLDHHRARRVVAQRERATHLAERKWTHSLVSVLQGSHWVTRLRGLLLLTAGRRLWVKPADWTGLYPLCHMLLLNVSHYVELLTLNHLKPKHAKPQAYISKVSLFLHTRQMPLSWVHWPQHFFYYKQCWVSGRGKVL